MGQDPWKLHDHRRWLVDQRMEGTIIIELFKFLNYKKALVQAPVNQVAHSTETALSLFTKVYNFY